MKRRRIGSNQRLSSDPYASGLTLHMPFTTQATPLYMAVGSSSATFSRAVAAWTRQATTQILTTAASGVARVSDYGLLVEPDATNLCGRFEDFETTWTAQNATVTNNQVVAPDNGTYGAKLLCTGTASDYHRIHITLSGAVNNDDLSYTIWMKRGAGANARWARMEILHKDSSTDFAYFDLDNPGTVGTTSGLTKYGVETGFANGWDRYWIMGNTGTGAGNVGLRVNMSPTDGGYIFTGDDGVSYLYVWGGQLERTKFYTSPIRTTGAAAARGAADSLSVPISGNFSNTVGTFYCEYTEICNDGANVRSLLADATYAGYFYTAGEGRIYDGTAAAFTANGVAQNVTSKICTRWDSGDSRMRVCVDGGTVADAAFDGNMGFGANAFIGMNAVPNLYASGWIRNLKVWNYAFADADMQAITT